MDVRLAVLADYANVSQEGKLNIMGVFSEVRPPALPFQLPTLYLVVVFQASSAEAGQEKVLRVVLLDSDGKESLSLEHPILIPKSKQSGPWVQVQMILGINLLRFEKADNYAFHILVDGDTKTTIPLRLSDPQKGKAV